MNPTTSGPLAGLRIIEIAGLGPGPFCGMLLAELGAEVVLVERPQSGPEDLDFGDAALLSRGKRVVAIDLKQPDGVRSVLSLLEHAEGLIEGMRPGTMERLGLGPDVCLARNPRLVFGRMTGWGQTGPLARAAGHDLNYISLSGALWYSGQPGEPPLAPPTLIGDIGGGAMYLAVGLLAAIMDARRSGRGQVVDAAIVDGSAHMLGLLLALHGSGQMPAQRGKGLLDGPHWYNTYRCADGHFISVGSLEPRFYRELCRRLSISEDPAFDDGYQAQHWPSLKARFSELFATRPRAEWVALLEGTDACFAPVLTPEEAAEHPHLRERGVYRHDDGVLQAAPAPRFSRTPVHDPRPIPKARDTIDAVLADWRRPAGVGSI